jgi:hypothetical protein
MSMNASEPLALLLVLLFGVLLPVALPIVVPLAVAAIAAHVSSRPRPFVPRTTPMFGLWPDASGVLGRLHGIDVEARVFAEKGQSTATTVVRARLATPLRMGLAIGKRARPLRGSATPGRWDPTEQSFDAMFTIAAAEPGRAAAFMAGPVSEALVRIGVCADIEMNDEYVMICRAGIADEEFVGSALSQLASLARLIQARGALWSLGAARAYRGRC